MNLPLCLLSLLTLVGVSSAQDPQQLPDVTYDKFLRHREDWSGYRGMDTSAGDWTDRIKFVALNDDGTNYVTFGGHYRTRFENWKNNNFSLPPGVSHSDSFSVTRALVHSDFHFGDDLRVFLELKTAQATDRDLPGGRRGLDMDTFAIQEVFVDYKIDLGDGADLTLRPGRQKLAFGKQRLVSPQLWGNTLRQWQGGSAILNVGKWNITGFVTDFLPVDKTESNTTADIEFWGLYGTRKMGNSGLMLDAYLLNLSRPTVTINGTTGEEDRLTLGARLGGPIENSAVDFDLEVAFQTGEVGSEDISAHMVASQIGYTFKSWSMKPRAFVGFDLASGDDTAGGKVGTFNQLFPLGHGYLGHTDAIGRQNSVAFSAGVKAKLMPKLSCLLAYHNFRLDSTADALYNPGSGTTVAGGTSSSSDIGSELDLAFSYTASRHANISFGYSHFFAGDLLSDAGPGDDSDLVYCALLYTF